MLMAEQTGKREPPRSGIFKSAFRAFSPLSETRLSGLDGLSAKFSQWGKYLHDKGGLATIPSRDCAKISAAAQVAQGKLLLKMGS